MLPRPARPSSSKVRENPESSELNNPGPHFGLRPQRLTIGIMPS
jgi:hypothetical protein